MLQNVTDNNSLLLVCFPGKQRTLMSVGSRGMLLSPPSAAGERHRKDHPTSLRPLPAPLPKHTMGLPARTRRPLQRTVATLACVAVLHVTESAVFDPVTFQPPSFDVNSFSRRAALLLVVHLRHSNVGHSRCGQGNQRRPVAAPVSNNATTEPPDPGTLAERITKNRYTDT